MLHTEINPQFQGSSAVAAMLAREFAGPEVWLGQRTAWRTAETEGLGQHPFMTAPGPIHREATV